MCLFEELTPLQFEPSEVFFGKSVTVTCGPPPADLNFGPETKAEWSLNGAIIHNDELHSFQTSNGVATLTISNFFATDNGKKTSACAEVKRPLSPSTVSLAGVYVAFLP